MAPLQLNTDSIISPRRQQLDHLQSAYDLDEDPRPSMSTLYPSPVRAFFAAESDLNLDLDPIRHSELDSDLGLEFDTVTPLSPRTLYAQSFDRPKTSSGPTAGPVRKNLKEMTGFGTTEEEFEALPLAVRRKYFSTLERLRFAENSRANTIPNLPIQHNRKSSIASRRGVNIALIEPRRVPSRRQRKPSRKHSAPGSGDSWFLSSPNPTTDNDAVTGTEEQVYPAGRPHGHRRQRTVIPDATDEAFYRATWQSRNGTQPVDSRPGTPISSMDDLRPHILEQSTSNMAAHVHESFRWVDEEQDLSPMLDDYHANLDGAIIPTPYSANRPSFRRNMTTSQMPLGRSSISSLKSRSAKSEARNRVRTRSRTMSSIPPHHPPTSPGGATDPNPAYYQHPEARLKLRVYLASPQKFDEAIEFGFPSVDDGNGGTTKENKPPMFISRDVERVKNSCAPEKGQQPCLHDDLVSLSEDDLSMAETESPITPSFVLQNRPLVTSASKASKSSLESHLGIGKLLLPKQPDSHSNSVAGSREMTLRMTLTRSDLRADETAIYGWQRCKSAVSDEPSSSLDEKCEMRGPMGGADGWEPMEKETCAMKRFWNKVRISQRKTA
ncbi:hypothetical protein QTJ16_006406 [Diplocarpon rosae]|uniref:Mucin n=1 Tax=Diplocarpon rosae TaxID=946125 RepID=A0AAD9SVF4_9HELO|nr:hypothetical protein QTJ16_006406 [Diplocarpon rosae]